MITVTYSHVHSQQTFVGAFSAPDFLVCTVGTKTVKGFCSQKSTMITLDQDINN